MMLFKWALPFIFGFGIVEATEDPIEAAFTKIYTNGTWGRDENGNGLSGGGASINEAKPYVDFLAEFLKEHSIATVVDVGCGDWQFSQFIDWSGIDYTGYDVVKNVVESNMEKFSAPNITFLHGNAVAIDLKSADLLICKDVLQHLPNNAIKQFLGQIDKFKYCLITNDNKPLSVRQNKDVQEGKCRPLDLSEPPFNLSGSVIFEYRSGTNMKQVYLITHETLCHS